MSWFRRGGKAEPDNFSENSTNQSSNGSPSGGQPPRNPTRTTVRTGPHTIGRNGGEAGARAGSIAGGKRRRKTRTIAGRRRQSRTIAAVVVALVVLSLPLSLITAAVGYRFFFSPAQEAAQAQSAEAALGTSEARAVDNLDRLEAARTLAVEFSSEYLTLDPEEDLDQGQERIGGFLVPELDAESVTPAPPQEARQEVLASLPVYARPVDGNVFEVHTRNRIVVEPLNPDPKDQGGGGSEAEEAGVQETRGPASGGQRAGGATIGTTTDGNEGDQASGSPGPEVQVLAVYVGVDEKGRAAVVDPPTLLEGSGRYEGSAGILDFTDTAPENLDPGGELTTLIDGYLAALYGRDESRQNLERFFIAGAKMPAPPTKELEFIEVTDDKLKPLLDEEEDLEAEEVNGVPLLGVYEIELWVAARKPDGPSKGMVVNQTHLLTAGLTEDREWLLLGER